MGIEKGNSTQVMLGLNWKEAAPLLRFRVGEETEWVEQPIIDLKLFYRIPPGPNRFCLGHVSMTEGGASYKGCTSRAQKGRKCLKCASADARYAANLHHAHTKEKEDLPPEFHNHMGQPNYLYLASFGDGSIKVGTTTSQRKDRRLREQGALWAIVVAKTADGFAVRTLEDLVTTELAIQQSVSAKKKINGLLKPINREKAKEKLNHAAWEVERLLLSNGSVNCDFLGVEWENDAYKPDLWNDVHLYPVDLSTGAHALTVVDVIGRIGAFTPENSSDVFIADLGSLFGLELEMGMFPTEDLLVQDALF